MEDNLDGWIKLNRNLLRNDLLLDRVALQVFVYMLLRCNDKGQLRISRFRTSDYLRLNPETFRSAVKRLERDVRITTSVTNGYTVVTIVNWSSYQQGNTKLNTKTTPDRHHYNKNRIEIKERFKIKPPKDHIPYGGLESIADGSN